MLKGKSEKGAMEGSEQRRVFCPSVFSLDCFPSALELSYYVSLSHSLFFSVPVDFLHPLLLTQA